MELDMDIDVEYINPDRAKRILETNYSGQRKINNGTVERYANDMKNGLWVPQVGGMITFDQCGRLIDGQHRMQAVIQADVEIPFIVQRNVPTEAYEVIDSGKSRTVADVLNVKYSNTCAAIAGCGARIKAGDYIRTASKGGIHYNEITKKKIVDYYCRYSKEIQTSAYQLTKFKQALSKASAVGMGLSLYVYQFINPDIIEYVSSDIINDVPDDKRVAAYKIQAQKSIINDTFNPHRQFAMTIRLFEAIDNDEEFGKVCDSGRIIDKWDKIIKNSQIMALKEV